MELFFLKICLYILISIFISSNKNVKSELFTAMVDFKDLIYTEKHFKSFVDKYIKTEERRLKNIERWVNDSATEDQNFERILKHPFNIFESLYDFYNIKETVLYFLKDTSFKESLKHFNSRRSIKFPGEDDLSGVATAFDRLIDTFGINISSIINGEIFSGTNTSFRFSANDCFIMGKQLQASEIFFNAISWFQNAMTISRKEPRQTVNISDVVAAIALSAYQASRQKDINGEYLKQEINEKRKNISSFLKTSDELFNETNFHFYEMMSKKFEENSTQIIEDKSFKDEGENFDMGTYIFKRLCQRKDRINPLYIPDLKCYYKTTSPNLVIQPAKVEDVFLKPRIVLYHDVLSEKDIDIIKNLSTDKLQRAEVDAGGTTEFRISKSSWLEDSDHPAIYKLSQRLQDISGLDVIKGSEDLQIANYGIGGFYITHYDYDSFLPSGEVNEIHPNGNRIATFLVYMSDVKIGGSTVFPSLNLEVAPQKGAAVFWYNLLKNGLLDQSVEHGACPVVIGSKWVCNKWITEHHQEFRRPCGLNKTDVY